jgi:hypothetical protein
MVLKILQFVYGSNIYVPIFHMGLEELKLIA